MPLITSIQKYSIHDGDGIRTTVFFKGCPLNCTWCHNPETKSYKRQLSYDKERCLGCRACVDICQDKAIQEAGDKVKTDLKLCSACGRCTDVCLLNLRNIAGEEKCVKDLVFELMKDEIFYEESGGGVTLSGGEAMSMDMVYMTELVKELKQRGVSVTIDTCGHVPYGNFEKLLPYVDTFLYDIKSLDPQVHETYTGVDNALVLENLEKLSADGARIYLRLPLIKEVNGTKKDILNIIHYLREHKISPAQINLLPYHNTGSGKYERMGEVYQGREFSAPSQTELKEYQKLFIKHGFPNTKTGG